MSPATLPATRTRSTLHAESPISQFRHVARTHGGNDRPPNTKTADGSASFSITQYAVKVGDLQCVRIPPGQSIARLEATSGVQGSDSVCQQVINAVTHANNRPFRHRPASVPHREHKVSPHAIPSTTTQRADIACRDADTQLRGDE